MLQLVDKKVTQEQLQKAAEDLEGYVKFVVDVERKVMTIGGAKHVDGEKLLLEQGSLQKNLWGGGYDTETNQIDFDSMINIRPSDNNFGRVVESKNIQKETEQIVRNFIS